MKLEIDSRREKLLYATELPNEVSLSGEQMRSEHVWWRAQPVGEVLSMAL